MSEAVRVLFLDFDGVLNAGPHHDPVPEWFKPWPFTYIRADLIRKLGPLAEEFPDFRIVISSTWRKMKPLGAFTRLLNDTVPGLGDRVICRTESSKTGKRGEEIKDWLDDPRYPVTAYAIVDDDSDMLPEQRPYFVQTRYDLGITDHDVLRIAEILRRADSEGVRK